MAELGYINNLGNGINYKKEMSSREIAEMLKYRHDNIKRTIKKLIEKSIIQEPQIEELEYINGLGYKRKSKTFILSKRDSLLIVAKLSPQYIGELVDRWLVKFGA